MKEVLKKITPLYKLYLFLFKMKNKFYNYVTIPSYKTKRETILKAARRYNSNAYFVETGTYMGDTVEYLKNDFAQLISIELSGDLAKQAAERFKNESKIRIVNGDSSKELKTILKDINTPVVFWLDGHYSSDFWVGDKHIITAKGDKQTPILEELGHIAEHGVKNHLILIDDARLFKGKDDYPELSVVKKFVAAKMPEYRFSVQHDIIRILPR